MRRHSTANMKRHFIDWFLSIPDVDETLVAEDAQTIDGFANETVAALFQGFRVGFDYGQTYAGE